MCCPSPSRWAYRLGRAAGQRADILQYLYLLFDGHRPHRHSNQVFTTEGHLLSMPAKHLRPTSAARRAMHRGEILQCPVYKPPTVGGGLVVGIERRQDYEYARSLVFGWGVNGRAIEDQDRVQWWEGGFCSLPTAPKFVSHRSGQRTKRPLTDLCRHSTSS